MSRCKDRMEINEKKGIAAMGYIHDAAIPAFVF